MHDIWNPWHGCIKISEGCDNCYMYHLDAKYGKSGREIYKTGNNFDYPLHKNRKGQYKIKSGEMIRVCMTSDFFLEEADDWREDAWRIMESRQDIIFFLLTKRPKRVFEHLPKNYGEQPGQWNMDNIFFNVTCENQRRADERIPILKTLPFKHKGVLCAPLLGPIDFGVELDDGQINQVICGGENYDGSRLCHFDWVKNLRHQCEKNEVTFAFIETGTYFVKDDKMYRINKKKVQSIMAHRSKMSFAGKEHEFKLKDQLGLEISRDELYRPQYKENCRQCGSRIICNGCSDCGRC